RLKGSAQRLGSKARLKGSAQRLGSKARLKGSASRLIDIRRNSQYISRVYWLFSSKRKNAIKDNTAF
ncbi:hypothetical protein, partial [Zymomonas mobilis]|uniref:hypothetical protein n=1 Tax=Zymomonas mobilis TaxID=542 RepID=UPI001C63E7F3